MRIGLLILAIIVIVTGSFWWKNIQTEKVVTDEHKELSGGVDYRISATFNALLGLWQSNEDEKFKREFKADSTIIDSYNGDKDATDIGDFNVFTKEEKDADFSYEIEAGFTYLAITFSGQKYYFKIIKVTPETLELMYLDGNGMLTFSKI